MSVKLGLYRFKQKMWCSEISADLPPHSHDTNSLKNELIQPLLRPQLSQALLDPEKDLRRF